MRINKNKPALTMVELLVVLTVMAILVALLVPALGVITDMAAEANQKAQFETVSMALDTFRHDFGNYPPSSKEDKDGDPYCGAQKLSEAMVGYDLYGFHPKSVFDDQGQWGTDADEQYISPPDSDNNVEQRKGPYVELDSANPIKINEMYSNSGSFTDDTYILTDTYKRKNANYQSETGLSAKIGTPILYYRAHQTRYLNDANLPEESTYNYEDNEELIGLPVVHWDQDRTGSAIKSEEHFPDLDTGQTEEDYFYEEMIRNPKYTTPARPHNPDSFILISAGKDGLYGTKDDIFNFEKE